MQPAPNLPPRPANLAPPRAPVAPDSTTPKKSSAPIAAAPPAPAKPAAAPAYAPPAKPSPPIQPAPATPAKPAAAAPAPSTPNVPAKTPAAEPAVAAGIALAAAATALSAAAKAAAAPAAPDKSAPPSPQKPVAPASSAAPPPPAKSAPPQAPAKPSTAPAKSTGPSDPSPAPSPARPGAEQPASLATNLAAAATALSAASVQASAQKTAPPASKAAPATKPAPEKTVPPKSEPVRLTDRPAPPRGGYGWIGWLLLLVVLAAAGYFIWTHFYKPASTQTAGAAGGHGKGAGQQVRVVTAVAATADIPIYVTGLGAVTPLNTDTIQSRVNGQLMKVLFTEGQMVKQGDLLEQIDARPYQAQLEQYNAQKEHDQAVLDNANVDLNRYQTLWKEDSIPQQTLATQEATVKQDQATVDSDQALIDATALNITYCNITSPIDGRVGLRLVDVGNYIQNTTSGLVVITQIQPITVVFTIPEDSIAPVAQAMKGDPHLPVDAYARGGFGQKLATGNLLTIDNQIDPTTGTVKLKATFPNLDNALFPNQFVNARMLVDTKKNVVTVPVAAVQHGTNNSTFVYTVDTAASTVHLQDVTTGATSFDGSTVEITQGVNAGDTVVTDGVDKLSDGAKVVLARPDDTSDSSAAGSGQHHHHQKPPSDDTNAAPAP
jgi:multidrug efflux system membrane fusion protein